MLKTISAALLAISVLAAPAMAATTTKTAPAPIAKTAKAPAIKSVKAKPGVMNANARMSRHHHRHYRYHRHHRFHRHFHKHMGAYKAHHVAKVSVRHAAHVVKRG